MIVGMKDSRVMAIRLSKWLGEVSPNDALTLNELVDYCDVHYPKIYGLEPWECMPEQLKRLVCELVAKLELARRGCTPAPGKPLQKSIEQRRAERVEDKAIIQEHIKSGDSSRIKAVQKILRQRTRIKENKHGVLEAVPHSHGRRYVEELLKEIKEESN
jgi:hypothetical protein